MLFNSIHFALFLPIVFLLYWLVFERLIRKSKLQLRLQNAFLVLASYVFYGFWDWRFLLLIAFTSYFSWYSGLLIGRQVWRDRARWLMWLTVVVHLGLLCLFKYYDFFVVEFARLFHFDAEDFMLNAVLPVGISFYTFQAMSYSIDVYREQLKPTEDLLAYFAYISFFPQLVAGPIERATTLFPQFLNKRKLDYAALVAGLKLMLWGLFKKVVIADNCAVYVDQVFSTYSDQSGSTLLLAAVFFTFQLYGDFSGYSDIAIGTAKLFGVKLMRNFNMPYFSRDIAEFWRRWHISLSTWFRDYVYIPLGGSWVSTPKTIRNIFIIFLLSGFWHGANWTFIAWGTYHAVLFLPLVLSGKNHRFKDQVAAGRRLPSGMEVLQMLLTFSLVVLGLVFFRAESIGQAVGYLIGICNSSLFSLPWMISATYFFPMPLLLLLFVLIEWTGRSEECPINWVGLPGAWRWIGYMILIVLLLAFGAAPETFIYFQF